MKDFDWEKQKSEKNLSERRRQANIAAEPQVATWPGRATLGAHSRPLPRTREARKKITTLSIRAAVLLGHDYTMYYRYDYRSF